jgi:hypothetical protein
MYHFLKYPGHRQCSILKLQKGMDFLATDLLRLTQDNTGQLFSSAFICGFIKKIN